MNTLRWYVMNEYVPNLKDKIVDEIEQIYMTLGDNGLSLHEVDLCWIYLEKHYYFNNYYGET